MDSIFLKTIYVALAVCFITIPDTSLGIQESEGTPVENSKIADAYSNIGNCLVPERADLLLITSSELSDSWKKFAQWKTKTGRPTKIVSVDEIKESYDGKDIQEKIRICCLDHIENQNTKFVVLGGDSRGRKSGVVPDRDTHHAEFYKYKNLPTDIYYLSELNWDANDDGVYGKFSDDMDAVSYTNSKATIGRIPVRTAGDVEIYTEKVIQYESMYPEGDFAKRMIYTCAVPHANAKLHTSRDEVKKSWEASDVGQFFTDKTPWDKEEDGDHELSAENWVELINQKATSKMHMHGHGLNDLWVLEDDSIVTKKTVDQLSNEYAYPVMTTVSCFTGQFDSYRDPCITESMLRKESGGAIAIIAPSREGIPVFHKPSDMRLMMTEGKMDGTTETLTRFWQNALKGNTTLGEAFRQAKQEMTTHARKTDGYHFVQCELNLLGDPSLDVRAKAVPASEIVASVTGSKIKISGAKNCEVCFWDEAELYEIRTVSENGELEFDVIKNASKIHLSVFAPNRNTWTKQLDIAN